MSEEYGACLAFLIGEISYSKLSFGDSQRARLALTISTPVKGFGTNASTNYLANRVVFWGKLAEEIAKQVKARNKDTGESGTKILISANKFGQRKQQDGTYTHEFTGLGYKVLDSYDYTVKILQSEDVIKIDKLFGE